MNFNPIYITYILFFIFVKTQSQGLKAIKNCIKTETKSLDLSKNFSQGLESIFEEYQKQTEKDLDKVDTIFVVFSRPDFLLFQFEEVRIWNRTTDVRAYTA